MLFGLMDNLAAKSDQPEGLSKATHYRLTFLSSVLRGCRLFSIALPKEKLLEVWLLQLEGLEYYTYFLPMIAWCLEEHL